MRQATSEDLAANGLRSPRGPWPRRRSFDIRLTTSRPRLRDLESVANVFDSPAASYRHLSCIDSACLFVLPRFLKPVRVRPHSDEYAEVSGHGEQISRMSRGRTRKTCGPVLMPPSVRPPRHKYPLPSQAFWSIFGASSNDLRHPSRSSVVLQLLLSLDRGMDRAPLTTGRTDQRGWVRSRWLATPGAARIRRACAVGYRMNFPRPRQSPPADLGRAWRRVATGPPRRSPQLAPAEDLPPPGVRHRIRDHRMHQTANPAARPIACVSLISRRSGIGVRQIQTAGDRSVPGAGTGASARTIPHRSSNRCAWVDFSLNRSDTAR